MWGVERVDVYVSESSDGLESTHFSLVSFETFSGIFVVLLWEGGRACVFAGRTKTSEK